MSLIKKLPIEYKDVCKAMQKVLRPREIMKKSRPRPSDEEIDDNHPLLSLKVVKDMLRTEWEWERKAMRKKKGKPPGKGPGTEKKEEEKKSEGEASQRTDKRRNGPGKKKGEERSNPRERANLAGDRGERKCFNCGGLDHILRDCKRGPVCNFCGEEGHKSFDCSYAKEAKERLRPRRLRNLKRIMAKVLRVVYPMTARSQSLV